MGRKKSKQTASQSRSTQVQMKEPQQLQLWAVMTDEDRQHAIRDAGLQIELWMARHARTHDPKYRANACAWCKHMENLIQRRSADQVRLMELELGLH